MDKTFAHFESFISTCKKRDKEENQLSYQLSRFENAPNSDNQISTFLDIDEFERLRRVPMIMPQNYFYRAPMASFMDYNDEESELGNRRNFIF